MDDPPVKSCQVSGGDSLSQILGDDLLLKVFQWIERPDDRNVCSLVCKRWLRLLSSGCYTLRILRACVIPAVLMRFPCVESLDFSHCIQVADPEVQAIALAYGARLRSLDVSNNKRISAMGMQAVGQRCIQLQNLTLAFCSIGDDALTAVANCSTLKVLKLVNCRAVTDVGLHRIASRCRSLVELSLRWGQGMTDAGIAAIAASCTALETLDLAYTKVSAVSLRTVATLPVLHHLCLAACSLVDDAALVSMRSGCAALQSLDLAGCEAVTDVGVVTFTSSVSQLEQLTLNYCRQITDAMLIGLPKLTNLRVLKLDLCSVTDAGLAESRHASKALLEVSFRRCNGVRDFGLAAVLTGCSNLERLDLTCCREITDATLRVVAGNCKALQSLKLEGCSEVTPAGLALIGAACPGLQELDCTDCSINDAGVEAIARCQNLRSLKLGFGVEITDAGAAHLGASCQSLTALDLYRCENVGDRGLVSLLQGCRSMQEINVSYTAITDEGMCAFSFCPDVANAELRGNAGLTSSGLVQLARSCPSLTDIDLKHCGSIGDEGLQAIAQHCSGLRQINLSYSPIARAGLMALAKLACMGNLKLVHCKNLDPGSMVEALLMCEGLKKLKLLSSIRPKLPRKALEQIENRGCKIRWMDKPDPNGHLDSC